MYILKDLCQFLAHEGEQRVGQSAAQNQGEAEQSGGRTE